MPDDINNPGDVVNHGGENAPAESTELQATRDNVENFIFEESNGIDDQTISNNPDDVVENPDDGEVVEDNSENSEENSENENPDENTEENTEDETPEEEDDSEEENSDEPNSKFNPEQQKIFNKAIAKEHAKTKAAKDELTKATTDLTSLKTQNDTLTAQLANKVVAAPSYSQPLAHITDLGELAKHKQNAWDAYNFASNAELENNVIRVDDNGVEIIAETPDGNGGVISYTKDSIAKMKNYAHRQILKDIPEREKFLSFATNLNAQLDKAFPEIADASSEIARDMNTLFVSFPTIKNAQTYKLDAFKYVIGQRLFNAAKGNSLKVLADIEAKSKAPAPKAQPKKTPPPARKPSVAPASRSSVHTPKNPSADIATKDNIYDMVLDEN